MPGIRCAARYSLVLLVLCALAPAFGFESPASAQTSEGSAPILAENEVPSLRTETSSTYRLEDGRYTTVVSSGPVSFRAADGTWRRIDNTLVESSRGGFAWENRENAYSVLLPARPGREAVRFEHEGAWVSFSLRGAPSVAPTIERGVAKVGFGEGVSVRWIAGNSGLKEEIVLAGPHAQSSFVFDLRVSFGLAPQLREDGTIDFLDSEDERVFSFAAPYMVDSSGEDEGFSRAVSYDLEKDEDGYVLRLVADRDWLNDPARVWPVTIDPTITLEEPADCHISNGDNQNNDQCEVDYVRVGFTSGNSMKRRTLLKFDLGAELPERTVTDATLALWCEGGSTTNSADIDLRRVTRAWTLDATWNKYNGTNNWTTAGGDFGTSDWATRGTNCSFAGWKPWSTASTLTLAELVNAWLDGTYTNHGMLLKQQGETTNNLLTFTSTNNLSASDHWPELRVTFSNTAPSVPEDLLPEYETADPDPTPTLSGTYTDSDAGDTGRVKFRVLSCPDELCETSTVVATGDGNVVSPGQTSSWTVSGSGLPSGQTYYWQAQSHDGIAYNEGSASQWSDLQPYHVQTGAETTDLEPTSGTVSYDVEPTLSATYAHPLGLSGRVRFEIETLDGTAVAGGDGTWVASGQTSSWTVPSETLSDTDVYVWSARGWDGTAWGSWASHATYETESGPDQAEVLFEAPMEVEDAVLWTELNDVRLIDFVATYEDSNEAVTLGYHLQDDVDDSLGESFTALDYAEAVATDYGETMTLTMLDVVEELADDTEITEDQEIHAGWIEASVSGGDMPVNTVRVSGATVTLEALRLDASVEAVTIRSEELQGEEVSQASEEECPENDWPTDPWGPANGRVHTKVLRDANGNPLPKRSIYQRFKWSQARLDRMFCEDPPGIDFNSRTYEADAHFRATDGFYLGKVKGWATNMVGPYYDATICDQGGCPGYTGSNSKAWTIGTHQAWNLAAGIPYWTKIVTKKGKASADGGNIFGQVGVKKTPFCVTGYCIAGADEQYAFQNWKYRAPSLRTWTD